MVQYVQYVYCGQGFISHGAIRMLLVFEIHLVMGSPVESGFLDFADNSCKSTTGFVDSN